MNKISSAKIQSVMLRAAVWLSAGVTVLALAGIIV